MELRPMSKLNSRDQIKYGIICRFENTFFNMRHDVATVMAGDTGGLSITWFNMARRTKKNLVAQVVRLYLEQDNAPFASEMRSYLPMIEDTESTTAEETPDLHTLIKTLGREDEVWKACCDTIIQQETDLATQIFRSKLFYDNDAGSDTEAFMKGLGLWEKEEGWETDLMRTIVLDGIVQGGYHKCVYRLFDAMRPDGERRYEDYRNALKEHFGEDMRQAADLHGEDCFAEAYCVVRKKWLSNLDSAASKTTYRMESFLDLMKNGIFYFSYGMPFSVLGHNYTITKELLGV